MEEKPNNNVGAAIMAPLFLILSFVVVYFVGDVQSEHRIINSCEKHKMYISKDTMMKCEVNRVE